MVVTDIPGTQEVSADGLWITWTPSAPLAPSTAYTATLDALNGGDTLAAIAKYGIADRIGYISTGGGAFLEFVEGKVLPAVAILEVRAKG